MESDELVQPPLDVAQLLTSSTAHGSDGRVVPSITARPASTREGGSEGVREGGREGGREEGEIKATKRGIGREEVRESG